MSKYDKIRKDNYAQRELEQQLNFASQGMAELVDDSQHTADIYNNAESVLNDIDEKFMQATKLDKTDVAFLMLATALQIGRWVLFAELSKAIDNKTNQARVDHNDKSIVDMEKEKRNQYKEKHINDEHIKSKTFCNFIWWKFCKNVCHYNRCNSGCSYTNNKTCCQHKK